MSQIQNVRQFNSLAQCANPQNPEMTIKLAHKSRAQLFLHDYLSSLVNLQVASAIVINVYKNFRKRTRYGYLSDHDTTSLVLPHDCIPMIRFSIKMLVYYRVRKQISNTLNFRAISNSISPCKYLGFQTDFECSAKRKSSRIFKRVQFEIARKFKLCILLSHPAHT